MYVYIYVYMTYIYKRLIDVIQNNIPRKLQKLHETRNY